MKKLFLTSVAALAACLCPPMEEALAASDDAYCAQTGECLTVTNNCNRVVHVLVTAGMDGAATLEVGDTVHFDTARGRSYTVKVFEGYYPVLPHDISTGHAHNANVNISKGGIFNGFCTVD